MSAHDSQLFDSSPHVDGTMPRPLKRSASVASLPTPPRTHHKRTRSDSDSSDEDSTHQTRTKRLKHKSSAGEADEEIAFWAGTGRASSGTTAARKGLQPEKKEKEQSDSSPSPAMLRYRVKAPVSPPPSRRQPQVQPNRASSVEPCAAHRSPVTPPRRLFLRAPSALPKTPTKKRPNRIWPTRDSPNNPFLSDDACAPSKKRSSEWDSSDDEGEVVGAPIIRQETPTPTPTAASSYEERPTITYVFRGQKATFANPLYNLPAEVEAASKLPIEHPDFEPLEAFPPKRLFSGSKRKSRDRSRDSTADVAVKRVKDEPVFSKPERAASQSCSEAGSEHEKEDERDIKHAEVEQRARDERERKVRERKEYLAPKEGLRAGAVVTERDEPMRRAVGPPRSA